MEKSKDITKLAQALGIFQSQVSAVKKEGKNPFFKSKYATLEDTLDVIKKPMANNGLSFSQLPCGENELTTILMHISGEYILATAKMSPKDNTPQGQGSAITYMRRYALSAILGLATEDDDDGNASSTPQNAPKSQYKPPTAPQSSKPSNTPTQQSKPSEAPIIECSECGAIISVAENSFSLSNYNRPLCRTCQAHAPRN